MTEHIFTKLQIVIIGNWLTFVDKKNIQLFRSVFVLLTFQLNRTHKQGLLPRRFGSATYNVLCFISRHFTQLKQNFQICPGKIV